MKPREIINTLVEKKISEFEEYGHSAALGMAQACWQATTEYLVDLLDALDEGDEIKISYASKMSRAYLKLLEEKCTI